jgi:hypothetical protein
VWSRRYGQRGWLRQLDASVTREMEDAVLRTIARLDGRPFPTTARLAGRWLAGRLPGPGRGSRAERGSADLESTYCAEVVAATYQAMGLLPSGRDPGWYDPGRFWSGDELELLDGARLGGEIAVEVPPAGTR